MYIPKHFNITDQKQIQAFIESNPFATLISSEEKLEATHLPINRFKDNKFYGHFAQNNPQANIKEDQEVLVIFSGPHAYISPTMYESEFNVPTWNYSAVHCYGTLKSIDDDKKVWNLFQELVKIYEGKDGWSLPDEDRFKELSKFIRFFEFDIKRVEAKFKFNQNKSNEDIQSVISGLKNVGNKDAADFMDSIIS